MFLRTKLSYKTNLKKASAVSRTWKQLDSQKGAIWQTSVKDVSELSKEYNVSLVVTV